MVAGGLELKHCVTSGREHSLYNNKTKSIYYLIQKWVPLFTRSVVGPWSNVHVAQWPRSFNIVVVDVCICVIRCLVESKFVLMFVLTFFVLTFIRLLNN